MVLALALMLVAPAFGECSLARMPLRCRDAFSTVIRKNLQAKWPLLWLYKYVYKLLRAFLASFASTGYSRHGPVRACTRANLLFPYFSAFVNS